MITSVLATKLFRPPSRPSRILRPRLSERLNKTQLGASRVTLVSAPAGFGKTTLLSEWIDNVQTDGDADSQSNILVAWLSLDEADNDLTRFLTYLIAALRNAAPTVGSELLHLLQVSPQSTVAEPILTALINEFASLWAQSTARPSAVQYPPILLILDDYHVITAKPIDDALAFFIEYMPPQIRLIIATREDPSLPLARLRARDQLTEFRAADLRFTNTETAKFLNQVMGLNLATAEIAALEDRTEGWIAGLQLAALSLQNHQNIPEFIEAFTGDNRYVVDYLVEEVLHHQPESARLFLLQTAILERLNGSLCEAVTDGSGGQSQLEALERGNFFIIPLDDKRQWYRYHHLFADVLRVHLLAEHPEQLPTLHLRASRWYEQQGSTTYAIRHALASQDFERAADLIERVVASTRQNRQEAMLLGWLQALPDELLRRRPVLSVHYAGTLLQTGQLDGVEIRLRDAGRWFETTTDTEEQPDFVDEEEFQNLPGWIAIYRAGFALAVGDLPSTLTYAQRGLDFIPEADHFGRGAAAALLGLAYWTSGDLEAAHRTYAEGMAHLQSAGNIADVIGGQIALADIRLAQGHLHDAMHIYQQGLQLALKRGSPTLRGTADMYVGMSAIHLERGDLHAALQNLLRSQEQGEHTGFPQHPYRWRVAMAQIREAQGDLDGALELLDEAERLYVSDFYPNVRPVSARRARVWIAQDCLESAIRWSREQGLSAQDNLSYLREFEHITLARLRLAQYQRDKADHFVTEAIALLERLLQAAEAGARTSSVIEIRVLLALAHQIHKSSSDALMSLKRALTLAEPKGYIRLFVDEGQPMERVLHKALARRITPIYTAKLLGAFQDERLKGNKDEKLSSPQPLIEPLSQRELEILRLFNTELSGPEIASELLIALSTVRTHTKSIYGKLNVNSRRMAVKRAIELGLL